MLALEKKKIENNCKKGKEVKVAIWIRTDVLVCQSDLSVDVRTFENIGPTHTA
jgi:hypothetical protein